MHHCAQATGRTFPDQAALHAFSVEDHRAFWRLLVDWSQLAVEGSPQPVSTSDVCEEAVFFPELRLSYAENLLAGDPSAPALVAHHASGPPERLTRGELRQRVLACAAKLRGL